MSKNMQIICFANSKKELERCIAGKSTTDKSWIRPVSNSEKHEVSSKERQYSNGDEPNPLDKISIKLNRYFPYKHQQENYLLDSSFHWIKDGQISWNEIPKWIDEPSKLWFNYNDERNDKVPLSANEESSLYLIHVNELLIEVCIFSAEEKTKRKIRGIFYYKNIKYNLVITDPYIEKVFCNEGEYCLNDVYMCISLAGAPFAPKNQKPHFYKLIASVIYKERF